MKENITQGLGASVSLKTLSDALKSTGIPALFF